MGETGVEHYWEMGEGMEEEKEGGQHPYETVKRLSVCLSHHSTAAAACGWFAAQRRAGRNDRSIAAGAQQQRRRSISASRRSAANASSVALTADVGS